MTHNSSGSSAILPIAEHYRVTYRGRKLIEDTKEPLFNACHALVAIGCKGRLEMSGGASYARAIARDIEQKVNNPPDSLSYTVTEAHLTERGRRHAESLGELEPVPLGIKTRVTLASTPKKPIVSSFAPELQNTLF